MKISIPVSTGGRIFDNDLSTSNHKVRVVVLLFIVIITSSVALTEAVDRSKIGGMYKVLDNLPAQEVTDSIEIMEFMSFFCGHCYRFSKKEMILKGRHPHRIKFKHIPIQWGNASTKPAEAYLIAKDMGKGDEMRLLLFKAGFEQHMNISQNSVLEKLAASIGLGDEFNRRLRTGEKNKQVMSNLEMSKKLHVNETPSFLIAGNVFVSPSISGGNIEVLTLNIDTIVGSLLEEGK